VNDTGNKNNHQTPLPWPPGDSRWHDGWVRCLEGVAVWHRWHQATSWWF